MPDDAILEHLSSIIEPDHNRDIVSLGMVRDVVAEEGAIALTLAMTTYESPHAEALAAEVEQKAQEIEGVNEVAVNLTVDVPISPPVRGRADIPAKHLIAISSGKGGVGKSTVSANLAVALAQTGAKVGLMDADILGPNIPIIMGVPKAPPPSQDKLNPALAHGVEFISMGFLVDPNKPLIWRGPMIHQAIRQLFVDVAWSALDYMVIDLPPGTGDAQLTLAQLVPLTGALIVTQPQEVALSDARRGISMFEAVDVSVMGVVENMAGDFFGSGGGETLAEERGLEFLGRIPLDPRVRVGGDEGQPVVVAAPEAPAAHAFRKLARTVAVNASVSALSEDDDVIPLTTIG